MSGASRLASHHCPPQFSTYKFYYVFGFMFAVYVILTLTTSCVTIVSTYFLLNSEGASQLAA